MPFNVLPHILPYFRAEKQAALYMMIVGAIAILVAVWMWRSGNRYRGMAIPLTAIAIIQLVAGSAVYLRTDKQIDTLTEQYYSDAAGFLRDETIRMDKVISALRIYKVIEITLLIGGMAMILIYRRQPALLGAGIGLVLQSAILLAFDLIARKRADVYFDAIRRMG